MNLNLKWSKVYDFVYGNLEDEKKVKEEIRKLQSHKYKFIENRNKNILSNFRLFKDLLNFTTHLFYFNNSTFFYVFDFHVIFRTSRFTYYSP